VPSWVADGLTCNILVSGYISATVRVKDSRCHTWNERLKPQSATEAEATVCARCRFLFCASKCTRIITLSRQRTTYSSRHVSKLQFQSKHSQRPTSVYFDLAYYQLIRWDPKALTLDIAHSTTYEAIKNTDIWFKQSTLNILRRITSQETKLILSTYSFATVERF
jgi:hypothetical protein